jgi:hypothetical protein
MANEWVTSVWALCIKGYSEEDIYILQHNDCYSIYDYISGSAPSDFHLFPGLKKQLKGRHFSSDVEVIAAA